ncbi:RNA polymerase sigma factor [Acidipila sp. EB88]|uniref:RNA polymerase sigma factor n=1 Tax=Acidipila sp. EB88 TaxID=2305226 RepID=UPI000F5FDE1C|nr:sigma-70 family RNA polymerase sigma factor [Acidipila sp. EB88]RRA49276.1 sigma-70 family RNA polymerase sigma factor [Acidipila sp. EB88]
MQDAICVNDLPEQTPDGRSPSGVRQPLDQADRPFVFEELEKIYSRRLFKQIIAITRHHEDAEDALQDALCNAYIALPLFERRCHVYTWLSRIAINAALVRVRKRNNLREASIEKQNDWDGSEQLHEIPDKSWSAEDLYCADEKLRQIANVAESLDPISKQVLHLRADDELSMEEIASQLGMSVSAVKARLYRARHVLRVCLPGDMMADMRN